MCSCCRHYQLCAGRKLPAGERFFLGPAVPVEKLIEAARAEKADLVGVSYRLTPETGERLLGEFAEAADELRSQGCALCLAEPRPVADKAQRMQFFELHL